MTRPSRTRRILKWAGWTFCAVCLVAWLVSVALPISYTGQDFGFALTNGQISYHSASDSPLGQQLGYRLFANKTGWKIHKRPTGTGMRFLMSTVCGFKMPRFQSLDFGDGGEIALRSVSVPLWIPTLLSITPMLIVIWRHRHQIPPDHCQRCGYNLFANTSGICPECGTPCKPAAGGSRADIDNDQNLDDPEGDNRRRAGRARNNTSR